MTLVKCCVHTLIAAGRTKRHAARRAGPPRRSAPAAVNRSGGYFHRRLFPLYTPHPPLLTHPSSPTPPHPPLLTHPSSPTPPHPPLLTHPSSPTPPHPPLPLTHPSPSPTPPHPPLPLTHPSPSPTPPPHPPLPLTHFPPTFYLS